MNNAETPKTNGLHPASDDRNEETQVQRSISTHLHIRLAEDVCAYLDAHPSEKITLEQLTRIFHIPATTLKSSFKAVYGVSVSHFVRKRKMQEAAKMLSETEETVLTIAGRFGYENASKFSAAFRAVMGVSPTEYRKKREENG